MAENDKTATAAPTKTEPQRADHARRPRNSARSDAANRLHDDNEARHAANMEAEDRRNNSRPTPTQHENDLAKLGHSVDEKEDDGSGPEQPVEGRRAGSYNTRDLSK